MIGDSFGPFAACHFRLKFATERWEQEGAAELRRRVTSPNGTTQAAIESFQAGGFEALVDTALRAAQVRGQELSAAND